MPTYITATEVRNRSGAPTSLIADTVINTLIDEVEAEMARWLNTVFTPTTRIDIVDGSGSDRFFTKKNPVLAVKALKIDGNSEDVDNLEIYKGSGMIILGENASTKTFISKLRSTVCQYVYGMLENSSTDTTLSGPSTAGTSVVLDVTAVDNFAVGDWIEITGMDGFQEVAQITAVGSQITVDQLIFTHVSGSTLVKLQIPNHVKVYMEIEAALAVALNAIGSTYTFNASYSIAEFSVVKGVPYTHWRESFNKLLIEREMRKKRIKPRPSIVVG